MQVALCDLVGFMSYSRLKCQTTPIRDIKAVMPNNMSTAKRTPSAKEKNRNGYKWSMYPSSPLSGGTPPQRRQTALHVPRPRRGARIRRNVRHQRCQGCDKPSRLFLDGSYGERIAYRLKKWSRVEVETPFYSDKSKGRLHQSSLCE